MADVIYCVSSGDYSDYRVLCACPTKKDAEAVVQKLRQERGGYHHDAQVETLPVITGDVEPVTVLFLTQDLLDDGTQGKEGERFDTGYPFAQYTEVGRCRWRWVRAPCHKNKGGRLEVWGTDHKRVRKVFSEKRAAIIAAPDVWREIRERAG